MSFRQLNANIEENLMSFDELRRYVGGIKTSGSNNSGQLGVGTSGVSSVIGMWATIDWADKGVQYWEDFDLGSYSLVALSKTGEVWGCGNNNSGALGDGTTVNKSTPILLHTDIKQISMAHYSLKMIKQDGTLWCVGDNTTGNLGIGSTVDISVPAQESKLYKWKKVSSHSIFNSINGSLYVNTFAIKDDNTLWGCGYNYATTSFGGATGNISTFVQVGTANTWVDVTCGLYYHAAVSGDGDLYVWGYNGIGNLGLGDTLNRSSPVLVSGLKVKSVAIQSMVYTSPALGIYSMAIITTDGKLYTTGAGELGNQGSGATTDRSVFTQVGALTDWDEVWAGFGCYHARKTDGTVWAWGYNADGQLADSTTTTQSSPVKVMGPYTNWKKIRGGGIYGSTSSGTRAFVVGLNEGW